VPSDCACHSSRRTAQASLNARRQAGHEAVLVPLSCIDVEPADWVRRYSQAGEVPQPTATPLTSPGAVH
ncbi:hypothetical protein, partial [Micromonospora harpali]